LTGSSSQEGYMDRPWSSRNDFIARLKGSHATWL